MGILKEYMKAFFDNFTWLMICITVLKLFQSQFFTQCSILLQSSSKREHKILGLLNHAHIWPNLQLEGGKPIPSP